MPLYNGTADFEFKVALHEIAHTLGLDHIPIPGDVCTNQTKGKTVMNLTCDEGDASSFIPTSFTLCDQTTFEQYVYPPSGGGGECPEQRQVIVYLPPEDQCDPTCHSCPASPIVVDILGDGIRLTDTENGVDFDLIPDGVLERVAWIAPSSDDAWLALDRNNNGMIDNGLELFGDYAPQFQSDNPNGFKSLGQLDSSIHGGNEDGVVSALDGAFHSLRLWQDRDHDGISDAGELINPADVGIDAFGYKYKHSRFVDEFGNEFRYRAKIYRLDKSNVGHFAYDVFLQISVLTGP